MLFQIVFPGALYSWFESQYQHSAPAHFLGKFVGGKGLPETHFCVPKEVRSLVPVVLRKTLEIRDSLLDSSLLFWSHLEVQRSILFVQLACPDSNDGCFDIRYRTLEP